MDMTDVICSTCGQVPDRPLHEGETVTILYADGDADPFPIGPRWVALYKTRRGLEALIYGLAGARLQWP